MRFKQLGRSGLVVSDLCLGTMIFGEETEAADLELNAEEMDQLDEASRLPELYPYRFIDIYGQRK